MGLRDSIVNKTCLDCCHFCYSSVKLYDFSYEGDVVASVPGCDNDEWEIKEDDTEMEFLEHMHTARRCDLFERT